MHFGIPPRVASPAPLPPNAHANAVAHAATLGNNVGFTSSMHTFVNGCSWGSFGNLAALGGSPFGSSSNLPALAASQAATGSSSTPPQQQQQQQQLQQTAAMTPVAPRAKQEPGVMRAVLSEPSFSSLLRGGTSA